ncbi:hypothetical protein K491DRAFT_279450 [Lophiostoma macrostomum CBS 122681]|uniref:DUF6604 domain-containing protein n=1 Tax=Lophiostoma macrostomum CBS 122681 TaxID=1314788 RepID=A0A6A6SL90_9PLEO|nr:hypothetical protein K491DRAFT_279450 [Lophiostoma macrostomum CBS 122681]
MANPLSADKLTSIYRQYKQDTAYIAGWLSDKSAQCGHQTTAKRENAASAQPRLKGKARKLAKENAKAGGSKGAADASPEYTIRVSDFIPMATSIARFTPSIQVPVGLGKLFSRAITERRRVGDWFNSPHNESPDEDDSSHAHFIDVLQQAHDILRPLIASAPRKHERRTAKASATEQVPLQNAFDGLTVDETPDHEEYPNSGESTIEEVKKLPAVTPVGIVHEEWEIEAEFFFAIQSFLLEIKRIRKTITKVWKRYASTGYDLVVATVSTNTAIELVRQAELELEHLITRPRKYPAGDYPV